MAQGFLDIMTTPSVEAAQQANGSFGTWSRLRGHHVLDRVTPAEAHFIAQRDSFYMATVAENGWPYVQHRGGPAGFLRVLGDKLLGFADFRGNTQYLSLGNLGADQRASLFLMDYPNRRRLKILARVEIRDLRYDPELARQLLVPGYPAKVERAMLFHLEALDWNCPQHITPRYTEAEAGHILTEMSGRLHQLEQENAELKAALAGQGMRPA